MNPAAPPELHLPDLPEVSVRFGAAGPRRRLSDRLSASIPMASMAMLALATWWLVKNTPGAVEPARPMPFRQEPDYTMGDFKMTRFDRQGRFLIRLEGKRIRHFPDRKSFEIDSVNIRTRAADGRVTEAKADHASANADGDRIELIGRAHLRTEIDPQHELFIEGEQLEISLPDERLHSNRPVVVRRQGALIRAAAIDYDNLNRRLRMSGPIHMTFDPPAAGRSQQP